MSRTKPSTEDSVQLEKICDICSQITSDSDLFSLCFLHFANDGLFAEIAGRSSPSKLLFLKVLNAPPTATDGVGGCYAYFANGVLKFGRSNRPPRRKAEWQRQCRGEDQDWMDFYWEIPYAKKFERVIHVELKRLGAWNGRTHCPYCGREHQEKFDLLKCGGKAGLVRIVEARLTALGWSWKRPTRITLSGEEESDKDEDDLEAYHALRAAKKARLEAANTDGHWQRRVDSGNQLKSGSTTESSCTVWHPDSRWERRARIRNAGGHSQSSPDAHHSGTQLPLKNSEGFWSFPGFISISSMAMLNFHTKYEYSVPKTEHRAIEEYDSWRQRELLGITGTLFPHEILSECEVRKEKDVAVLNGGRGKGDL
ncbi:hypothetical protein K438DRAFT_1947630 [Mycena galopus ATCC 62051]|nr:hypothetical protein K438DRAFT_1947630 [Mycena galopus ATCC 62051]